MLIWIWRVCAVQVLDPELAVADHAFPPSSTQPSALKIQVLLLLQLMRVHRAAVSSHFLATYQPGLDHTHTVAQLSSSD